MSYIPYNFIDLALKNSVFSSFEKVGKTTRLLQRLSVGGYFDAALRSKKGQHTQWLESHYASLVEKGVQASLASEKPIDYKKLMRLVAEGSGQLVRYSEWASFMEVDVETLKFWLKKLDSMHIIKMLPCWNNEGSSQRNEFCKVYFLDTGLHLAALGKTAQEIFLVRRKREAFLESFVYYEVLKLSQMCGEETKMFYYLSRDKIKVDMMVEGGGKLVAIEVTSAEKVYLSDFQGLRHVQEVSGERFSCGILFHDGDTLETYGPSLYAMPFHVLWSNLVNLFPTEDL